MHWAINDWNLSPEASRPEGTQQIDDKAVQTPFKDGKSIHLTFPEADCPSRSALKPAFEMFKKGNNIQQLIPAGAAKTPRLPALSCKLCHAATSANDLS